MTSVTSSAQPTARVAFSRLLWVGPLTILAAIVANVIIQQIAVAVLQPDPAFMPLTFAVPIVFTLLGVLGAVIVYAVIGRVSRNPIQLFRQVALVTLVISFIPDILMLITGFNPGTTAVIGDRKGDLRSSSSQVPFFISSFWAGLDHGVGVTLSVVSVAPP